MSLHSACYPNRVETGFYNSLASQINSMDNSLARTELDKHILRTVTETGHYSYVNKYDKSEYNGVIFGEVCCAALGTKLSAQGTYFAGGAGTNEVRPFST
jgi:hypothetical protein